MRERKRFLVVVGGVALALIAISARANFVAVSQRLTLDAQDQNEDTKFIFNQTPDFTSLESRPASSFQIDFAGNYPGGGPSFPKALASLLQGQQIHPADVLQIRPATGGGRWGPVIDPTPLSLLGDTADVSIPTKDLGWSGHGYDGFSMKYGKLTSQEVVTLVPTPTALQTGLAGMVIAGGITAYIRRRARLRASQRTG